MKKIFLFFVFYCAAVRGVEIPLSEISETNVREYYLDGWIPIGVFKKNKREKDLYTQSLSAKYIPYTEYSKFFGNGLTTSIYDQQIFERNNPKETAYEYGVFILIQPTVGCSFLTKPTNKFARFKEICTGTEFDGNGRPLDKSVVNFLATPSFTIKNNKIIIEESVNSGHRIIDFTPPRAINRTFKQGMDRIASAFDWHRSDIVIDELDRDKDVINDPRFQQLIMHIMLFAGTDEQLKIVDKAISIGFDIYDIKYEYADHRFSAMELAVASLGPKKMKFLSKISATQNKCISIERMSLIKQASNQIKRPMSINFDQEITTYFDLKGTEYCWKGN